MVVAIIALLISILLPSLGKAKEAANKVYCAANLKGIGESMFAYGQENNGVNPVTSGPTTGAGTFSDQFGVTTTAGFPTPSQVMATAAPGASTVAGSPTACLWILTLQGQAPAKMFICKSDRSAIVPSSMREPASNNYYLNFSDQYAISYSINYPWNSANWRTDLKSSSPVMCDMGVFFRWRVQESRC